MAKYFSPIAYLSRLCLAIMFLCCAIPATAWQTTSDTSGSAYIRSLSISYPLQNELFLANLRSETDDKKLFNYYRSKYKLLFEAVTENIKEGKLVHNRVLSAALDNILAEIKAKNPVIPADIRVLLLRDGTPDAYTIGDGHIFLSMGLFDYLESEDQVAGVLAHEIAHLLMRHSLSALKRNYEEDRASVADVKALRRSGLKKADRAFDLVKNSVYRNRKISREHEMHADSLGYLLLKNTRYHAGAFPDALGLITYYDTIRPNGLSTGVYKQFFDLPRQMFNENWLKMEDFSSYSYGAYKERLDKDSISSHPEGQERIKYLGKCFRELQKQANTPKAAMSDEYKQLRAASENERMPNLMFEEAYGLLVYTALLQLQKDPHNKQYRKWLARGFEKIYEARKNYQLNRYLDRVSPKEQSESYMRFLSFMWNLKIEEIKNIADFYHQGY